MIRVHRFSPCWILRLLFLVQLLTSQTTQTLSFTTVVHPSSRCTFVATTTTIRPDVQLSFVRRHIVVPSSSSSTLWLAKNNEEDELIEEEDVYEEAVVEDDNDGNRPLFMGDLVEWNEDDDDDDETEEEEDDDDEWDDPEAFASYEVEDDVSDPNYMKQKEIVQQSIVSRNDVQSDLHFDALDYIMNDMTDEEIDKMEALPMQQEIEARVKGMELTEQDLDGMDTIEDIEEEVNKTDDILQDPPYPIFQEDEENILEEDIGITNEDMVDLENAWKVAQKTIEQEPWDRVVAKDEDPTAWAALSNETLEEMEACLDEIGGSSYNVTRFLLYDLDFNVTNLMLAAVKHNRKAPILFQHWFPQILTYKRYNETASARNFDYTWDDVENADIRELEAYYRGMGYDEIPTKAPAETGIISLEELDEEEIRMAALENWYKDVYNPESDEKDFDDDNLRDEDNVFSKYYKEPQHPDLPTYEDVQEDLEDWDEEMGDDDEYRDQKQFMGRDYKYKVVIDEDFEREFRGHLVICCTGDDSDLEIAEKITKRMKEEYGKQVFVETRVIAHARLEDNVFEVWLESYEIDLLHSKRRASMNTEGWEGPAECDDKEIEHLVKEVGFLISDDSRHSYRYDFEMVN